ncbi:MAG: nucleotidyltransferase family protein [Peptococcaceae bacterium]|nr:nucleotidyltransferase family protein [Peptococcaceae bacterium]
MKEASRVSAILLAAGLSRRMGRDKLLLPYRGKPLISHALSLISNLAFHEKIVVTTQARLSQISLPEGITAVVNPCPENGQSESVRLGVAAAAGDAYMFFSSDQPLLDRETSEFLLSHMDGTHIIYPSVEGVPRLPIIFPAHFRKDFLVLRGDQGGRKIRDANPDQCLPLELPAQASLLLDVDTWEDYTMLLADL